jgi:hypothetical protein
MIHKITLANIEWNDWNGFVLTVLGIEYQGDTRGFNGELLGIHFSKDHFIFEIVFVQFVINSPFN